MPRQEVRAGTPRPLLSRGSLARQEEELAMVVVVEEEEGEGFLGSSSA